MDIWGDVLERNCHSSEWLGHHRSGHRKRKKLSFTETLLSLQASLSRFALVFSSIAVPASLRAASILGGKRAISGRQGGVVQPLQTSEDWAERIQKD